MDSVDAPTIAQGAIAVYALAMSVAAHLGFSLAAYDERIGPLPSSQR